MSFRVFQIRVLASLLLIVPAAEVVARENYSPDANVKSPNQVYWGDTHLHTRLSADAYMKKNRLLTSADAYRFAMGDTVTTHDGRAVKLRRPLDFIVIADHAEELGVLIDIDSQDSQLLNTEFGRKIYNIFTGVSEQSPSEPGEDIWALMAGLNVSSPDFRQSTWGGVVESADKFNSPGSFTTFSGFEWSSNPGKNYDNLHRVVIFKDGAQKVTQVTPYSSFESEDPEDLWRYLSNYSKSTDGDVIAIPHNSNVSNGRMFALVDSKGQPIDLGYAKLRSRWEPLVEVTQMKGDSETHPSVSPDDKFADYETWDGWPREMDEVELKERRDFKPFEYARPALKLGLAQNVKLGVNPFKFGMIGSTDSHTSLSTADENNFWGKTTKDGPAIDRMMTPSNPDLFPSVKVWKSSAAGYSAVWAQENTRESIFAAMKRKEVYASTGPRISVRFFGGWDYQSRDALRPDLATIGYSKGVPMGGDLVNAAKGKSPSFLIRAVKDPDGANLDRVQVIKGWHDSQGQLHELIYNVALSDGRTEDKSRTAVSVGNTVNIKDASYINSIGDPELAVVWQDPDFDRDELAFYYLRVLEIPTPRWTVYDAKFFDVKNISKEVPVLTQERAYSSPIWYTP